MATAVPAYLEQSLGSPDGGPLGEPDAVAHTNEQLEPVSLETNSSSAVSSDYQQDQQDQETVGGEPVKCSAVHTLERDMPDFDYSHLVRELRDRILADADQNAGLYSQQDICKCRTDDWYLSRFLLRHKLDVEAALDMLKRTMRYNNESLTSFLRPHDFPAEFYQLGGVFVYEPDRKGNVMQYLRVKVHRKTPEIQAVAQAFLYFQIQQADEEARGRGIAMVIDCTGASLQSADLDMLFFHISSLKNYFPKGLSYILVHNLPWILKPFWHIAKAWIPDEHRELIKFSNDETIYEYVAKHNLPDFMGGTCQRDYRKPPDNCTSLREATKLWGVDKKVAAKILAKFEENLPAKTVERAKRLLAEYDEQAEANDEHGSGPFPVKQID